jgi:thymidylate synthase|tara:strand:+ start:8847 stop:9743 length:897 start_codon:yes stop_codon:yes gene_type:complete
MKQYIDALNYILKNGEDVNDRTGTGTRTVFGYQMRFPLSYSNFPAVTTKRLAWKSVVGELLWFLEGSTDERRLAEITFEKDRTQLSEKNTIWTANANKQAKELGYVTDENENYKKLGPVYGFQWRNFDGAYYNGAPHMRGTDQISWIINEIKTNPDSRRIILSAWNPNQLDKMTLPPCHTLAQFRVINGKLSCQMYQRSADMFLGVPFNIASYALLTHMIAQMCELEVGEFIWTGGDCHIYQNHMEQVKQQLERTPVDSPILEMPEFSTLEELLATKASDYNLVGYNPMPSIKAPMAV